jgi:hypothetical protein
MNKDALIRTDEELKIVLLQLTRVEDALAALRHEVLPKNRRNFELLSEGYVEQIDSLRSQIAAYLGSDQDKRGIRHDGS